MDNLKQYYKITNIKPENKKTYKPIYGTSNAKILFTLDEITLYYDKKDMFLQNQSSAVMKILLLFYNTCFSIFC